MVYSCPIAFIRIFIFFSLQENVSSSESLSWIQMEKEWMHGSRIPERVCIDMI